MGEEKGDSMRRKFVSALVVAMMMSPVVGMAQMRGLGRVGGTVTDASGAPIAEVNISATLNGSSGTIESKSDEKGAWAVAGMGKGEWDVVFEKPGYAPRKAKVSLAVELARVPAIAVAMKKAS